MEIGNIDKFRWTNEGLEKGADILYIIKDKLKDDLSPYYLFPGESSKKAKKQFLTNEMDVIEVIKLTAIREYLLEPNN